MPETKDRADRPPRSHEERRWRALWLLASYRVLLACALTLTYFFYPASHRVLGHQAPLLFELTALLYVAATIVAALMVNARRPATCPQLHLMLFSDIVALVLLMHASGGIGSGFGILLLLSIAITTPLLDRLAAMVFAAIAATALLAVQSYEVLHLSAPVLDLVRTGLFGIALFAVAILASNLSQRLRHSERLAERRGAEVARLSELSNYVIQHMQAGLLVIDDDDILRMANEAAWRLLDMPITPPSAPLDEVSPALARALRRWREDPDACREVDIHLPGERQLSLQFTAIGLAEHPGVMLLLKDSGEINRQAARLKLASLGKLTASIAHEIRNPLGAIGHAAQLLNESPGLSPADQRLTEIIHDNSLRVNRIVEDVLGLSRRTQARCETLRLADWLQGLLDEHLNALGVASSQCRLHITPPDTEVFADPGQLSQIVVNILRNAVQHSGRERNALEIQLVGGRTREAGGPLLDILDNGVGIPPETLNRIFEPFFTSRNDGTGLGLYIVRELAELNDIDIRYLPPPTGGSCFRLIFKGHP